MPWKVSTASISTARSVWSFVGKLPEVSHKVSS